MSNIRELYDNAVKALNNLHDVVHNEFLKACDVINDIEDNDDEAAGALWDERDSREYETDQLRMLLDELEELNIDE